MNQYPHLTFPIRGQPHPSIIGLPHGTLTVIHGSEAHRHPWSGKAQHTGAVKGVEPLRPLCDKQVEADREIRKPEKPAVPSFAGPSGNGRENSLFPIGQAFHRDPLSQGESLEDLVGAKAWPQSPPISAQRPLCLDGTIDRGDQVSAHVHLHGPGIRVSEKTPEVV